MSGPSTSWHEAPLTRSSLQLGWLAVLLFCMFVMVALLGYAPSDPSMLNQMGGEVTNPCGPVGANLADVLFVGFGHGAWSVFLGMVAAVLALAGRPLQPVHEWILFLVGLGAACGVLAATVPGADAYPAGGEVGEFVVRNLEPWLGTVGTWLVCGSVALFCLVAIFRISLHQIAARSVAMGEQVLAWSGKAVSGAISRSLQGPPPDSGWPTPGSARLSASPDPTPPPPPRRLGLPPFPGPREPRVVRRAPWSADPRPPRRSLPEPLIDAELLPPVDPDEVDVVFETTDPSEYGGFGDVYDPASLIDLFPPLGPRHPARRARVGLVPAATPPPGPGEVEDRVVEALARLRLRGRVTNVWEGPVVTTVGLRPERNLDPEAVVRKAPELARELGVPAVRVVVWDGTRDVGIEVPSHPRRPVPLTVMLGARPDPALEAPMGIGVDVRGEPQFVDLAEMSHLAVIGTAGSGKSNALRAMVATLLHRPPRAGLGLVLITPEAGLFDPFADRPELVQPVVRRPRVAAEVLAVVQREVERRRLAATPKGAVPRDRIMLAPGHRSRASRQRRWIVVIDRWAALETEVPAVGATVSKLVAHGPAVGVHIVVAMRDPATWSLRNDGGPAGRLALTLPTSDASRRFLGVPGAESLLGQGDALWLHPDGVLSRIHVADAGVERVAAWAESLRSG